jgi:hypothetical protein
LAVARVFDAVRFADAAPRFNVDRVLDDARFFADDARLFVAVPRLELARRFAPPRFDVVPRFVLALRVFVRPPEERRLALRPFSPPSSSFSESPPISFFATVTAAGTATPIAAPATTFLGESPSSSLAMHHLLRAAEIDSAVTAPSSPR